MGGVDAVLEQVQASIDAGEYRWAAQVLDHAVFAAQESDDVSILQTDVLEQLSCATARPTSADRWRPASTCCGR